MQIFFMHRSSIAGVTHLVHAVAFFLKNAIGFENEQRVGS